MKKTYQKPNLREIKMGLESIIATSGVDTPNTVGLAGLNSTGAKVYLETQDWK